MVSWLSANTSRSFSFLQFSIQSSPCLWWWMGVFVIKMQDLALGLLKSHTIGLRESIQLPRSLYMAFVPSSRSIFPLSLVLSVNLQRVHSIPPSKLLIKILKKNSPSADPLWNITSELVTGNQLNLTVFTTILWAWPSSQTFAQQWVCLIKPWAANFSKVILCETKVKGFTKV